MKSVCIIVRAMIIRCNYFQSLIDKLNEALSYENASVDRTKSRIEEQVQINGVSIICAEQSASSSRRPSVGVLYAGAMKQHMKRSFLIYN